MIRQTNNENLTAGVLHVRFDGRSCDVPLNDLDIGNMSTDEQVKNRVASYLGVTAEKFTYYKVDRHETGNMTVRPEAVFG